MTDMLTAIEAGKVLGLSARAMYQPAAGGKIKHYRPLKGAVRFAREDIEDYRRASCRLPGTRETSVGASTSTATFKASASAHGCTRWSTLIRPSSRRGWIRGLSGRLTAAQSLHDNLRR